MTVRIVDPETCHDGEPETLREQTEKCLAHVEEFSAQGQDSDPSLRLYLAGEREVPLPRHFTTLTLEILTEVGQGCSVSIGTGEGELTTSEAAELLNVSRPHLVKLIEEGKIPFHKVGTHRRVYRKDVLEYKARQHEEVEKAMQNLTDQAQELDLGY
jgi:excisionase family DNA binding protein